VVVVVAGGAVVVVVAGTVVVVVVEGAVVVVEGAAADVVVEAGGGVTVDEVGDASGSVVANASDATGGSGTASSPLSSHPPRATASAATAAKVHVIALDLTDTIMPRSSAIHHLRTTERAAENHCGRSVAVPAPTAG
jgi:hypothetical protein